MSALGTACAALLGEGGLTMPWLEPYRGAGIGVAQRVAAGEPVASALSAGLRAQPISMTGGRTLRFVPQDQLPEGEAYEAYIARTACVPTRDNPHDLFNGLVWLRFPALKRRLNSLHAQQIVQAGVLPTRGPARDALTLFDENAGLLRAPATVVEALRQRDWPALFIAHRAAWQDATLTLFGHALLEKLLAPRKAITAHVWVLPGLAEALPQALSTGWLAAHRPSPLPVLGVPGWWAANQAPEFYADASVFRPAPAGPSPLT